MGLTYKELLTIELPRTLIAAEKDVKLYIHLKLSKHNPYDITFRYEIEHKDGSANTYNLQTAVSLYNEYLGMDGNKLEQCRFYDGCPYHTGGCYGLPDEGCPVYRWFKQIIEKQLVSRGDGENET